VRYYSLEQKKLDQLDKDLFYDFRESGVTLVYQLFGSINKSTTPAYTENDIMETLLEFHTDMGVQPKNNLFQELKASSLLFIGSSFDDWLYRLFIRIISNTPYGGMGQHTFVADDFSNYKKDPFQELSRFLRDYNTEVFHAGSSSDFVDILFEKLGNVYPEEIIQPLGFPAVAYISFTGRDRVEARHLAAQLREDGINVWLDEWEFIPGDELDQTIFKFIEKCAVFIPLISENSRQVITSDGKLKYHIREWELAYSRQLNSTTKIILPVKIDNTDWMYDSFKKYISLNIPGGRREGEYEKLKDRLLEVQRRFSE
jgi:hypothetical protein